MKTKLKISLLLLIAILLTETSVSQTVISAANGNNVISTNTTWTESDNGYIVEDPVTINTSCTLTIIAGVNIEVYTGCYFDVNGSIQVLGSANSEVVFTAYDSYYGWSGIDITNNGYSNVFNYCIIEYVKKSIIPCGLNFSECGAVYLNSSDNTSFNNCTFRYNEVCSGGGIAFISSYVEVNYCNYYFNTALNKGGGIFISDVINSRTGNSSVIQYCDIVNNEADYGGGICIEDCENDIRIRYNSLRLNNTTDGGACYFEDITGISDSNYFKFNFLEENNATGNGGCIYLATSENIEFRKNIIQLNHATGNGGGLYIKECSIILKSETIKENESGNNGGGVYNEDLPSSGDVVTFVNCLIAGNTSEYNGGGIYTIYDPYQQQQMNLKQYNNTISDNYAQYGSGGGIYHENCYSTTVNCIIWGNNAAFYYEAYPDPNGTWGYSYTCTQPITGCSTCTSNDPLFETNGIYMISFGSSCYNTGLNNVPQESLDFDGNNRICHNTIDIGAYEDPYIYKSGNICTQTWTDHNPNGIDYVITDNINISSSCTLTIEPGTTIAYYSSKNMNVDGSITAVGNSTSYITFTATDPNSGWGGIRFINNSSTSILYYCVITEVNKPTGVNCNCTDDATSYPQYSGAVYIENSSDIEISNSKIYNNYVCAQGGGIYVGISSNPGIHDNEIYDNTANYSGGGICIMYSSDPEISGNVIFSNSCNTKHGGGIRIGKYSSPSVYSNNIHSNFGKVDGGGISICTYCDPVIYNNLIVNNNTDGNGGGIYMRSFSNPGIYNCTIADNTASGAGGGGIYALSNTCYPVIKNTIIYDNSPDQVEYDGADADGNDGFYEYCDIGDIINPGTNIDSPPLWVDVNDYHLKYGLVSPYVQSPCINAGDPSFTPPTPTPYYDLDVNARFAGGTIDIGCYENDGSNQNWWIVTNDIKEIESSTFQIKGYPNPVEDLLNLSITSENNTKINIQLINSLGKTIYNNSLIIAKGDNSSTIDIQQFSTGIYFLKVTNSSQNSKIMKVLLK
jgi:parallel beta-helix repeat protein